VYVYVYVYVHVCAGMGLVFVFLLVFVCFLVFGFVLVLFLALAFVRFGSAAPVSPLLSRVRANEHGWDGMGWNNKCGIASPPPYPSPDRVRHFVEGLGAHSGGATRLSLVIDQLSPKSHVRLWGKGHGWVGGGWVNGCYGCMKNGV